MKTSTTIRLDTKAKKALQKLAAHIGVSLSDLVNMFAHAVEQGKMYAGIMEIRNEAEAFEYPAWYAKELDRESEETMKLYRKGKIKGYTSGKEMGGRTSSNSSIL